MSAGVARVLAAAPLAEGDIPDARLRALYEYWVGKCAGRPMPRRADIDVIELGPWLGNLMLIEVIDGGAEFRYRVYGSTLAQYYGHDFTGKTTEAVREVAREAVRNEYRMLLAERRALVVLRDREVRHRTMRVAKLALPLSTTGERIDMLLVGCYPLD
jgi:hypothetical protein